MLKEDVFKSINENFRLQNQYRFLFKDSEVIWSRIPKIKKNMVDMFSAKKLEFNEIFEYYRLRKFFRKDINTVQINFLAEQTIFTINIWLSATSYLPIEKNKIGYFVDFTFRTWLPYLSKIEMNAWESMLNNEIR